MKSAPSDFLLLLLGPEALMMLALLAAIDGDAATPAVAAADVK